MLYRRPRSRSRSRDRTSLDPGSAPTDLETQARPLVLHELGDSLRYARLVAAARPPHDAPRVERRTEEAVCLAEVLASRPRVPLAACALEDGLRRLVSQK